jgi:hypothetical protein
MKKEFKKMDSDFKELGKELNRDDSYTTVRIPKKYSAHQQCLCGGNYVFPVVRFLIILFNMMVFSFSLMIIFIAEWCKYYSPYLMCDVLPFLTAQHVDTNTIAIVMLVLTIILEILGALSIHYRKIIKTSIWITLFMISILLALDGCCLTLFICAMMNYTLTIVSINVFIIILTSGQLIFTVVVIIEFFCVLKNSH